MSQISRENPVTVPLNAPPYLMELSEEQFVEILARGAVFKINDAEYRVAPMRQKMVLPEVFAAESFTSDRVSQALTSLLHTRIGVLGNASKEKTLRLANEEANQKSHRTPEGEPLVAFYGFNQPRRLTRERYIDMYPEGASLYIDMLNTQLGLTRSIQYSDIKGAMKLIEDPCDFIEGSLPNAWHSFLQQRKNEINPFAVIAHREEEGMTPHDPWLANHAFKNLLGKHKDTYLAEPDAPAQYMAYARAFMAGEKLEGLEPQLERAFLKLASVAMIRRLCKVGLDFFKSQGIPVVFHWTDVHGAPFAPSDPNPGLDWQKQAGLANLYKCFTFSEMHYAQKNQHPLHKVYA